MGMSKNIHTYSEREMKVLTVAIQKDVVLNFPSEKDAFTFRNRIYGLRSAIIRAGERAESTGVEPLGRNKGAVANYLTYAKVSCKLSGSVLTIGSDVATSASDSIVDTALRALGESTPEEEEMEAIKAMEAAGLAALNEVKNPASDDDYLGGIFPPSEEPETPTDAVTRFLAGEPSKK